METEDEWHVHLSPPGELRDTSLYASAWSSLALFVSAYWVWFVVRGRDENNEPCGPLSHVARSSKLKALVVGEAVSRVFLYLFRVSTIVEATYTNFPVYVFACVSVATPFLLCALMYGGDVARSLPNTLRYMHPRLKRLQYLFDVYLPMPLPAVAGMLLWSCSYVLAPVLQLIFCVLFLLPSTYLLFIAHAFRHADVLKRWQCFVDIDKWQWQGVDTPPRRVERTFLILSTVCMDSMDLGLRVAYEVVSPGSGLNLALIVFNTLWLIGWCFHFISSCGALHKMRLWVNGGEETDDEARANKQNLREPLQLDDAEVLSSLV